MQNKIGAVTARMEEAEGRISEIEDKIMGKDEAKKKRDKKILDHEERIIELRDSMKHNNIHTQEFKKERQKGAEGLLEQIIAENFPNLGKEEDIQSNRHRQLPSDSIGICLLYNIS